MYLFSKLVHAFHVWRKYNDSLRELSRLGDRELADIGIMRADIQQIAWDAAKAE